VQVFHANEKNEYYFKEGCFILEMLNDEADNAVSIARARVEPEKETALHALTGITERYVILQGQAEVEIDGQTQFVRQGSVVLIPPGSAQKIKNLGEVDLVFLAICSPRFKVEHYQDLSMTDSPANKA